MRWSDVARSPPKNIQAHNRQDLSKKSKAPNRQNHISEKNDSHRNPKGFTMGFNKNSPLSVSPRPHWAYVFATGYSTRTQAHEVKRDIEANLQRKTGKIHFVKVDREDTRYDSYRSFRISCWCINSEVFMDSTIWP